MSRPMSAAYTRAWQDYYKVKQEAQKEYDREEAKIQEVFRKKVSAALDKACNTPIN